ncbi:hypothetical protein NQ176_g4016 [Zarea fungicola]|uniref:Uncharacterized protein n=1 Tax=Zarea fungicola TaxID=93591 RepID=A0ACC1NG97_9HYPO|nr:hypothetical protein NQ176_g4016 [Lecanicillium fungicola]
MGGLVIDLSEMRKVTVDEATKQIHAQGGALWEDVDNAAASKGLATVGGTVNHTGVGGLTLGGGFGWLSGQYGTTVDNLVSARIVVANGDILTASVQENSDLFWAIRGAGHNFGVVVEFVLRGHDQPDEVYAGSIVFTPDKLTAVIESFNARMEKPDPKGGAMVVFAKPPDSPGPVVIVNLFYNGSQSDAEIYFKSVLDLESVANMMQSMPYRNVNGMLNAQAVPGGRRSLKAITFDQTVRPEYIQNLWDDFTSKLEEKPDLSESFLAIEFYDLAKTASIPVDATAFATRGQYRAGILGMKWSNADDDLANRAWARSIRDKCHEWIVSSPQYAPASGVIYEYGNYLERKITKPSLITENV